VKDQSDDACAVCGTVFTVAGWVCATVGVDGVVAGVCATATGAVAGVFTATGAEAGTDALPVVAIVFAIATSVLCMPLSVPCTAVCCEGVSVVFAASDVFNCESVAASVLSVPWNSLICAAESPAEAAEVGAVATGDTDCDPVPAIDGGITLGNPPSPAGTIPACISIFARVAFATASSCCMVATWSGVSACAGAV